MDAQGTLLSFHLPDLQSLSAKRQHDVRLVTNGERASSATVLRRMCSIKHALAHPLAYKKDGRERKKRDRERI